VAGCSDDVNEFPVSIKNLKFLCMENYCVLITNSTLWIILF